MEADVREDTTRNDQLRSVGEIMRDDPGPWATPDWAKVPTRTLGDKASDPYLLGRFDLP